MHSLSVRRAAGTRLRVLCLGAHSDDIEIGCGGLLLSLIRHVEWIEIDWVVLSARGPRALEARRSAALFLKGARRVRITVQPFRDGFFPYDGARLKRAFEQLKRRRTPDLILTHCRDDRHQDHRQVSDLTWQTFRDHWILEYEIPKFDGDLGAPNTFVPLDTETCVRKIDYLRRVFGTQRDKHWFTDDTFMGLLRLRGMECRAPNGYAEAFYSRKAVLHF
jgi:LmbE family N-acetylglucosaminyl deacetylase